MTKNTSERSGAYDYDEMILNGWPDPSEDTSVVGEFAKKALPFIVGIALIVTVVVAIIYGTGRSERAECEKWSQDAVGRPGYFLASWQDQQCRANGIIINVPVVK